MKRDPWVLYCEAFRECFGTPTQGGIQLSPVALDAFYRKVVETECARPEGGEREVVIRECWEAINAQIKEGHLPGDGWDESARRNGLIIAANILAGKLGWPIAKYAEELPTPQGER